MSYRENLAVSQDGTLRLRYHCRNSRCTAKLHPAVANPRDAFCCRGCFETYYRHRCLACERPIPRTTERQVLCGRVKCAISSATALAGVRVDYLWDWPGAEREFKRALELNPSFEI